MTTIDATATRERPTARQKKPAAPSTAVARPRNGAVVAGPVSPLTMLNAAIQQNVDLEKLTQLTALYERWEANEARKAYNRAFAAFKAEAVKLIRDTDVKDGPLKGKKYASKFAVVNAVTSHLSTNGLSASWRLTKDEKDWLEVTCTLRHVLGHSESVSMGGLPDTGPGRNAIQSRSSTNSYLEKLTLKAICGIAEQGDDNDGAGAGNSKKSDDGGNGSGEARQPEGKPAYTADEFAEKLKAWSQLMADRKKTAQQIIATVQSKRTLTPGQIKKIRDKEPKE